MIESEMTKCGKKGALFIQALKMDLVQFNQMAEVLKELAEQLLEEIELKKLSAHEREIQEWLDESALHFIESHISNIQLSIDRLDDGAEQTLVDSIFKNINEIEDIVNQCPMEIERASNIGVSHISSEFKI